jgi:hypothetical protein
MDWQQQVSHSRVRDADFTDKWIIDLLSDKAPPGPKPCAAVAQLVTDEWPVISQNYVRAAENFRKAYSEEQLISRHQSHIKAHESKSNWPRERPAFQLKALASWKP